MPKFGLTVKQRKDWADDKALLALQCNQKPPPQPSNSLGHNGRDAEHLDPLRNVADHDRA
jgi:hypothetical protein